MPRTVRFVCGQPRKRIPTAPDRGQDRFWRARRRSGAGPWPDCLGRHHRRDGRAQTGRMKRQVGPLRPDRRVVRLEVPDRFACMDPDLLARPTRQLMRLARPVAPLPAWLADGRDRM